MNTRPLAEMALQVVRSVMQKDADYKAQVMRSPAIRQVVEAVEKPRADNLRFLKAIVVLLRNDPGCVVVLSFPRSRVVECAAELQDGVFVFHAEVRQKEQVEKHSSYWIEDGFVEDMIRTIVSHPPKHAEVLRCPVLGVFGRMTPPEFADAVEDVFGALPQRKKWDRLYTQAAISTPR